MLDLGFPRCVLVWPRYSSERSDPDHPVEALILEESDLTKYYLR